MNFADMLTGKPFNPPKGKIHTHTMEGSYGLTKLKPEQCETSTMRGEVNRQIILEHIENNGQATTRELCALLEISGRAVNKHLQVLIDNRKIRRIDLRKKTRTVFYVIA